MQPPLLNKQHTAVVMQPAFFPWAGYFDLMDQSKVFVLYNDVQFVKQGRETRNSISTSNGILQLSIPTLKSPLHTKIEDIQIDKKQHWNNKVLRTLQNNYSKSMYYQEVIEWFSKFLDNDFDKLQDHNIHFICEVADKIGIQTEIVQSSVISVQSIDRIDKLIEITQMYTCSTYLSTTGAFGYLDEGNAAERFRKNNLELVFHNYHPSKYDTGKLPYVPYMSIVDLLFHCGFSQALSVIRTGRKPNYTFQEYKTLVKTR